MPERLVVVSLAHNDDQGRPSRRVSALEIDLLGAGVTIRLLATDMAGPVCRLLVASEPANHGSVKIGRHRYPFVGYRAWVGSMVWDAVHMERPEAKRLLVNARESGWWSLDDAPTRYWNWWHRGLGHLEAVVGG